MSPTFNIFTISIISVAIAESLSLPDQAKVSGAGVNNTTVHSTEVGRREEKAERTANGESVEQFARNKNRGFNSNNEKIDAEKLSAAMKLLSGDGKQQRNIERNNIEQRNIGNLSNPVNVEKKMNSIPLAVPVSAQQERAHYVQDLNWKSNLKTTVASTTINNLGKKPINQQEKQILNNKKNADEKNADDFNKHRLHINTQRQDINKLLQNMQSKLHDKDKFYIRQGLHDPYLESLIRKIWQDIRRSLHDVKESELHANDPMEIDKYIAILERDLRELARDQAELQQYDRNRYSMRVTRQIGMKR